MLHSTHIGKDVSMYSNPIKTCMNLKFNVIFSVHQHQIETEKLWKKTTTLEWTTFSMIFAMDHRLKLSESVRVYGSSSNQ